MLAAALLQVLEAEFRRLGLVLDREANKSLRSYAASFSYMKAKAQKSTIRTAYCRAMSARR